MNRIKTFLSVALALLLFSCTAQRENTAAERDTILDAYWMLMSLEGQNVPETTDTRTAYIRFQENEDDVIGFAGCNKFSGKYELVGESALRMSELSTSRMACEVMDTENKLMEVLQRVDSYRISSNILTLYDGDKAVATFMTGTERSIDNEVREGTIRD